MNGMDIIPLSQVQPDHLPLVGAKAASLARLHAAHVRVPEGFVITDEARRRFLAHNQLGPVIESELSRLQVEELHSIEYASRVLHEAFLAGVFTPELETQILQQFAHSNTQRVSVRSSAFAPEAFPDAWAGELRTELNVSSGAVLEAVKRCWASLYSAKSLYVAASRHAQFNDVRHAVIIQRLIQAESAGFCYTAHPVHRDPNLIVIEASFGLGDGIEHGHVTPDTYTVKKHPFSLLEKHVVPQTVRLAAGEEEGTAVEPLEDSGKQKLSDEQIKSLAKQAAALEKKWGQPLCLEWAYADDWYFLQARPLNIG